MTKAEIISVVTKETGLNKEDEVTMFESFMETIKNSLNKIENVYIKGFWKLYCQT